MFNPTNETAMRHRKAAEAANSLKSQLSALLAESLAALISGQVEVGLEAVRCRQNELAALVACQIFDAIDWARLNFGNEGPGALDMRILAHLKGPARKFRSLQELEDFTERHLSSAFEDA